MSREKEERGAKKKKNVLQSEGCRGLHLRKPRMLGFYPVLFLSEMEF